MMFSRISAKGKVTLRLRVRQALQVKPGDRVVFLVEATSVLLQPLRAPARVT
jgi:bifunctional DNA-binding transcriptional regulator/antitoxin component of YhaV-PrlF toxin-antitoxin module